MVHAPEYLRRIAVMYRRKSAPEHPTCQIGTGNLKNPEDLPQNQTSAFQIPSYAMFGSLRILVSPFMRYNLDTKETDIIMCNSKNLGALIVDAEPHVRSWDEPQYDIHNMAIEESYGV